MHELRNVERTKTRKERPHPGKLSFFHLLDERRGGNNDLVMRIHRHLSAWRQIALVLLAWATQNSISSAWGPHPEITQAAVDVLAPDDALRRQLGDQTA